MTMGSIITTILVIIIPAAFITLLFILFRLIKNVRLR